MTTATVTRFEPIRARYLAFAENEARGVSPLYEALARAVAESDAVLGFIAALPEAKQQPNLVFAAVRHLYGTPRDARYFAELVARHAEPIRRLVLTRSTQTNEPGRCAALLPALARLREPLALLEVGASAGLCLLPDRYGYDYGRVRIEPRHPGAPVFPCIASDATPLPSRVPEIVWRAGIDLNPVDLGDPEAAPWLETLVWPGNEPRADRLRSAIAVAREHPPTVVRGDLLDGLSALAATAPRMRRWSSSTPRCWRTCRPTCGSGSRGRWRSSGRCGSATNSRPCSRRSRRGAPSLRPTTVSSWPSMRAGGAHRSARPVDRLAALMEAACASCGISCRS